MRYWLPVLLFYTLMLSLPVSCAVSTRLAADGKALLPIIISPQASQDTKDVAAELAAYLGRIAGAEFTVQAGDGAQGGIVLGTLAQFPDAVLEQPLAIRNTYDGKEAFVILTDGKRVRLISNTDLGASHAAFRFLEEIGCRWFFPAKEWEVVPSIRNLSVNLDIADRPAILSRRIWYGFGLFTDMERRPQQDYTAWTRHNRMASSLGVSSGTWIHIILANKALIAQHPEYLALVDGKRQEPQLCVSNPAVRRMITEYALAFFRKNPDRDMVSLEASDGLGQCECEQCVKLGSISDRVFGVANEAARAVAKEFPGKLVGLLAYGEHCEPPSFPLEPNVYVQSTAGFIRGKYTFDELTDLWPKTAKRLGFYLYLSVWMWDYDMLPGGNGGNLKYIREMIPKLAAKGAQSFNCESGSNWGPHGRGYYIANKLMWNPQADVDALLEDFYTRAFGPAAPVMQRYYERVDPGNRPLMSEQLLAWAFRDIDEAAKLAHERPDVLARIDHLKQYLHYVRLRRDYLQAPKEQKLPAALAMLTHVYRTRYSYMNHWQALLKRGVPDMARALNQPAWNEPNTSKPWAVKTFYTHEETEQRFREDLAHFQPQPVQEIHFSDDLIPSGLTTPAPAASAQRLHYAARYALYSRAGEPLELVIAPGQTAWYRNRPDARYTLTDRTGAQVVVGQLPLDGADHLLALPVPAAGVYWLVVSDNGAGWAIKANPGMPVSLTLSLNYNPGHQGLMQRMYFYVPKGTKQIQYYWEGIPHDICGPDGKVVMKVTEGGKYILCNVPEGMDGQAWSFVHLRLGRLLFFTCPNYLAASPDALLVPREALK